MKLSIFTVADHHPELGRSVSQFYNEITQQCLLADELGFDSFFVAEHHFHPYGAIPNPAVFLAALAARTKQIHLGPAISILTFHNPLQVAEDYAMLSHLSNERVKLGIGSGYLKHEFEGFGLYAEEKRERFDENLAILTKALSGKKFTHTGKYTQVQNVQLNVMPDKPLPLYVAVLRSEAAYHVGLKGQNIICVPYASVDSFADIQTLISDYRRGFKESGSQEKGECFFAFHAHVAETDEKARENAADAFNLYADTRLYARKQQYDDILKSGLGLFGAVKTVAEKLGKLKDMGVDNVLLLMNFGKMKHEQVMKSMRLFAELNQYHS